MDDIGSNISEMTAASHNVAVTMMRKLGIEIVTGKHQPGARLATEIENAEAYGLSRSAYREALRMLTAKGLLSSRQKTGTVVNPRSSWHLLDPEILAWSFQGRPSEAFVDGLFELRLAVEPMAAGLAAQRRTSAQMKILNDCVSQIAQHTVLSEKGRQAKRTFHMTVFEATANEFLTALAPGVGSAAELTIVARACLCPPASDPMADHQRLVRAIGDQSVDLARGAATTLVLLSRENTFHALFGHRPN